MGRGGRVTIQQLNITQLPDFKTADYQTIIHKQPSAEELLNIKPPRFTPEYLDRIIANIKKIVETSPGVAIIANGAKIN